MKKQILIIAAMTGFLWSACGSSNKQRMDNQRDSLMTDTNMMDSTVIDSTNMGRSTDTPALGTDNIRMDSMNNSSKH